MGTPIRITILGLTLFTLTSDAHVHARPKSAREASADTVQPDPQDERSQSRRDLKRERKLLREARRVEPAPGGSEDTGPSQPDSASLEALNEPRDQGRIAKRARSARRQADSPSLRDAEGKRAGQRGAVRRDAAVSSDEQVSLRPRSWLPSNGPECIHSGRLKGFCEGPRRVPEPHGQADQLAQRLGLGARKAAVKLLLRGPPDPWVQAARDRPLAASWHHPVEGGRLFRGLGSVQRLGKNKQGGGPRSTRRKPHAGLDIGANEGAPIRAAQSGIVVYSDNQITGYGNLVMVVHPDASVALYGHCRATYVFPGQLVKRGQIIAEVGHTGYARGSHLHFEYRVEGRPRDPTKLFEKR